MAYTAATAVIAGWLWLILAVGVIAIIAAELRPEPESQPIVLVVPAPQILTAQVAEAEVQVASASWYGPGFYGRQTASGATYTGDEFTAAHRSWPFGTLVRLHNPANGRTIVVRINDRGPYDPEALRRGELRPHPTRSLDLSRAAAEALGITEQGVADLEARVLVWGEGR